MANKRRFNSNHAQKRRVQKKEFSFKDLSCKQKKLILWGSVAALVVIIVLVTLTSLDLIPHLDGSLQLINGKLKGVVENDIVSREEVDTNDYRYYNLGSIETPEGFYSDPSFHEVITTSTIKDLSQKYCYRPNEEGVLNLVSIQGTNSSAEEMVEKSKANLSDPATYTASENFEKTSPVKGNSYHGYYSTSIEKLEDLDDYGRVERAYYGTYAIIYLDTAEDDKSIMVFASYKSDTKDEIPTADEIYALLDQMADTITIRK